METAMGICVDVKKFDHKFSNVLYFISINDVDNLESSFEELKQARLQLAIHVRHAYNDDNTPLVAAIDDFVGEAFECLGQEVSTFAEYYKRYVDAYEKLKPMMYQNALFTLINVEDLHLCKYLINKN